MPVSVSPLHFLLFTFAGWINQHQQSVIEYLHEENLTPRIRNRFAPRQMASCFWLTTLSVLIK